MDHTTHTSVGGCQRATYNIKNPENSPTRLVEVWHLCDVAEVNDGKVLNLFGDRVQRLVHHHALRVPVVPETNDDDAILFGFDRLVDVPARGEVRQEIGHPGCRLCVVGWVEVCRRTTTL